MKSFLVDSCLLSILENYSAILGCHVPPLVPETALFCLKIDGVPRVFHAVEAVRNGGSPPAVWVCEIIVAAIAVDLL